MGKLILRNNGVETQLINGVDFSTLSAKTNTYVLGINTANGFFEKLDPSGNIIDYDNGGVVVTEVTYSELVDKITGETLTTGSYYNIVDFQTCYDQPNYDENGNPIIIGNYRQGPVEPILVLATDINKISTTSYQPLYPNDRIQYDWTWNMTEITSGITYGRITERIDEFNNRTDYDHRNIVFKRYTTYFYNMSNPQNGTLEILDNVGSVTGTGTNFTSLNVGNVIKIKNGLNYKVVNVVSDTEMYITGTTINTGSNLIYYLTFTQSDSDGTGNPRSYDYKHNNIIDTESRELPTFRFQWELDNYGMVTSRNNYIGNHSNFRSTGLSHSYFLLANNVFSLYSYSNTLGDRCYNNSSYTWFNRNKISGSFYNNSMWRGFYANVIGEYCNNNIFGSYTWRNKIGEGFEDNITFSDLQNNIINNQFNSNILLGDFYKNNIENGFNNNLISSETYGNLIGNGFNDNIINTPFYDNQIDDYFGNNNLGDPNSPNANDFYNNEVGVNFYLNTIKKTFNNNVINNGFTNNVISGETRHNVIGNIFEFNTVGQYNFEYNKIGSQFKGNEIFDYFTNNNVGNGCSYNDFSGSTEYNKIGEYFVVNTLEGTFKYNTIGVDFWGNYIGDGFGFVNGNNSGNKIGGSFNNNYIGKYFSSNIVGDYFSYNDVGTNFQSNDIKANYLNNLDFTTFHGNILTISYTTPDSSSDDTYNVVQTSTDGYGYDATFSVTVSSGIVSDVVLTTPGFEYNVGDVITVSATQFNGLSDLLITVNSISDTPIVYKTTNSTIFLNDNATPRLSYYDGSDVLTIIDINN